MYYPRLFLPHPLHIVCTHPQPQRNTGPMVTEQVTEAASLLHTHTDQVDPDIRLIEKGPTEALLPQRLPGEMRQCNPEVQK